MSRGKVAEPSREGGSEPSDGGSGTVASPSRSGGTNLARLGLSWSVLDVVPAGFGWAAWLSIGPGASSVEVARPGVALRFEETGQVPEIEADNAGDAPLLVPAHLILSGGWQARAIERSTVIAPRGAARVPVKCVEAGRWAPRDERTARTLSIEGRAGLRTRWSTARNMSEQLARHGRYAAEQSAIWQHVEQELSRTAAPSHTRSYEAYLQSEKLRHIDAARAAAVAPPAQANALLVFPHDGGFWLEAYPTPGALAAQADDLLSDLFDAPSRSASGQVGRPAVDALLQEIGAILLKPLERISGTIDTSFAVAEALSEHAPAAPMTGTVTLLEGEVAHLSLGRLPVQAEQSLGAARASDWVALGPVSRRSEQLGAQPEAPVSAKPMSAKPFAPRPAAVPRFDDDPASKAADPPEKGSPEKGSPEKGSPVIDGDTRGSNASIAPVIMPRVVEVAGEGTSNDRPRVTRTTMREVYARARDLLPDETPGRDAVQGYRLLRSLDGNVSWVDIRIGGDGYAVVGSHDRCDLVLPGDPTIWLRHMIATCVRLDNGTVALRLIDLKTDVPFFLDDDNPQWSVTATGPFAVRLGRHVICGFPIGAAAEESPAREPFATAARTQQLDAATRSRLTLDSMLIPGLPGDLRTSRPSIHEPFPVVPSAPVSQIQDLIGPSASPNHVRVTLERGGMGASVEISLEALDAGVLLGRALNCFDGGLRRIFCDAVSRAHVLLLRDHDEVYAFDLCTTNGTRVAGRRIRRFKLSSEGSVLELGKKVTFRWHRRGPSNRPAEPLRSPGAFVVEDAPPGSAPLDPKKLN
ncbi:MAG: FHA domain-containing protein [Byssovorax sp.]